MNIVANNNLFYDPRKILLVTSLTSLIIMSIGIIDYEFTASQYLLIGFIAYVQIFLMAMGPVNIKLKIQFDDRVGWAFIIVSLVILCYNIVLIGLPFLLIKIIFRIPLNEAFGEYYHHNIKLTFILWPILAIMIPLSIVAKNRALKIILLSYPIVAVILIQVRMPFIWGIIYYLMFYQMLGRKVNFKNIFLLLILLITSFYAITSTRIEENLYVANRVMGATPEYAELHPIICVPLLYLGGPLANGFEKSNERLFNLNLLPFLNTLPAMILPPEKIFEVIPINLSGWNEANNAASSIASFSHMFGIIGMILFILLIEIIMILIGNDKIITISWILALYLVFMMRIILFYIGNYWIDPTLLGELLVWTIAFSFSKISLIEEENRNTLIAIAPKISYNLLK